MGDFNEDNRRKPELMWAAGLMAQAAAFGVSVYCKPNLTVIKQYPEV